MVIVEEQKKQRALAPAGAAQTAICVSVVEYGSKMDVSNFGKERTQAMFDVTFELPDSPLTINGQEEPQWVRGRFWFSCESHQMGRDIKKRLGKLIDNYDELAKEGKTLQDVLKGLPALITIEHVGGYARVTDVIKMPPKMTKDLEPQSEVWSYDPSDPNTNWDKLQPWQQDEVKSRPEFKMAKGEVDGETDKF